MAKLAHVSFSTLRLQILLRVPVRVVDDTGVGSNQVETQSSSTGAEQEHFGFRIIVKVIDALLTVLQLDPTVQLNILVPAYFEAI